MKALCPKDWNKVIAVLEDLMEMNALPSRGYKVIEDYEKGTGKFFNAVPEGVWITVYHYEDCYRYPEPCLRRVTDYKHFLPNEYYDEQATARL